MVVIVKFGIEAALRQKGELKTRTAILEKWE
jgi:hypothetical protein